MPEVIIVKDQDEAGELYARCVADLIKGKPDAVLGLATGSSPLAAYRHLAAMVKAEDIDVSKVRGFALDEYIGLPLTHPESYHSTIHRTVVEPLGLDPEKVHVPGDVLDGAPLEDGERIAHAGPEYDAAIEAAGGIDVQILGIGTDGHVGFNEPGSSLASGTRVKTLAEQTRVDNARFFDDDINQVPTHCITQGIGTILKARHLVLLAFGEGKAEAVEETCEGGVSAFCPASALQLHRTRRSSSTRPPPPACATRTTTSTPSSTSRLGRASDQRPDRHIDMRSRTGAHDGWVPRLGDPSSHGAVIIAPRITYKEVGQYDSITRTDRRAGD